MVSRCPRQEVQINVYSVRRGKKTWGQISLVVFVDDSVRFGPFVLIVMFIFW